MRRQDAGNAAIGGAVGCNYFLDGIFLELTPDRHRILFIAAY
jgi:hypothetical protein